MATNFDFLEKENTLYELALFAEDLLVDGTTKLEYITAIDNMRKVLGLMMTRWVKKANITDADIKAAASAKSEAKYGSKGPDGISLYTRMESLEAYGIVSRDVSLKLNHIRREANNTIHPEDDDGKIFEKSKEDVFNLARSLYVEFYECAYTYANFQQITEPVKHEFTEEYKAYLSRLVESREKNNGIKNKNNKQQNSKNKEKAKPESKPQREKNSESVVKSQPDTKAEPVVKSQPVVKAESVIKPEPEVKPEQVVTPRPEVKSDPVITPQPVVKPEPVAASQPAPTPASKIINSPVGYDNPFKDFDVHESEVAVMSVKKRGVMKVILWAPVLLFFCFSVEFYLLDVGMSPYEFILTIIYIIVGITMKDHPRTKTPTWKIVISVIMSVCSFAAVFEFGGASWIFLPLLFVCSLLCLANEVTYLG